MGAFHLLTTVSGTYCASTSTEFLVVIPHITFMGFGNFIPHMNMTTIHYFLYIGGAKSPTKLPSTARTASPDDYHQFLGTTQELC